MIPNEVEPENVVARTTNTLNDLKQSQARVAELEGVITRILEVSTFHEGTLEGLQDFIEVQVSGVMAKEEMSE